MPHHLRRTVDKHNSSATSPSERKVGLEKTPKRRGIVFDLFRHTLRHNIETEEVNDAQRLLRNSLDTRSNASPAPGPNILTEDSNKDRERVKNLYLSRYSNLFHLHPKPADPMRRVQWKRIEWSIITGGVLVACVAGTVISHGLAAPVFVLVPMAWNRAEKEIHAAEVEAGMMAKKNREAVEHPE